MIILDPTAELKPILRTLTPLGSAPPASIALVDISKPRGDLLLDHLSQKIRDRFPAVAIERYRKPTFAKAAPEDLRTRIAESHPFVILALAD